MQTNTRPYDVKKVDDFYVVYLNGKAYADVSGPREYAMRQAHAMWHAEQWTIAVMNK